MIWKSGFCIFICLLFSILGSGCNYNTQTAEDDTKDPWYREGARQLERKDKAKAIEAFQRTIEIKWQNMEAHKQLGLLYAEEQDNVSAIFHLRNYLALKQKKGGQDVLIEDQVKGLQQKLGLESASLPVSPAYERQVAELRKEISNLQNNLLVVGKLCESYRLAVEQAMRQGYVLNVELPEEVVAYMAQKEQKHMEDIASGKIERYTIRSGDTFQRIARKVNCSEDRLLKLNPDKDPRRLKIGDVILVPAK